MPCYLYQAVLQECASLIMMSTYIKSRKLYQLQRPYLLYCLICRSRRCASSSPELPDVIIDIIDKFEGSTLNCFPGQSELYTTAHWKPQRHIRGIHSLWEGRSDFTNSEYQNCDRVIELWYLAEAYRGRFKLLGFFARACFWSLRNNPNANVAKALRKLYLYIYIRTHLLTTSEGTLRLGRVSLSLNRLPLLRQSSVRTKSSGNRQSNNLHRLGCLKNWCI